MFLSRPPRSSHTRTHEHDKRGASISIRVPRSNLRIAVRFRCFSMQRHALPFSQRDLFFYKKIVYLLGCANSWELRCTLLERTRRVAELRSHSPSCCSRLMCQMILPFPFLSFLRLSPENKIFRNTTYSKDDDDRIDRVTKDTSGRSKARDWCDYYTAICSERTIFCTLILSRRQ